MKISLDVVDPREAGYAAAMFDALQDAMIEDPMPIRLQTTETSSIGDTSHSVTSEQVSDTAALQPTGSKRGRKSEAEKALIAAEKAKAKDAAERMALGTGEMALRPGDALKGVDAKTLAQALGEMPLVGEADGVQVRVMPGTPSDEIEQLKAAMAADTAKIAQEVAAAELVAEAAAKKVAATAARAATAVADTGASMDTDLAALFRKVEPAEPVVEKKAEGSKFSALSGKDLMREFTGYINSHGGLFWARRVLGHFGLEVLDDLKDEQTRFALENPDQFKSPADA